MEAICRIRSINKGEMLSWSSTLESVPTQTLQVGRLGLRGTRTKRLSSSWTDFGETAIKPAHPVTLNSFQGPFRLPPSSRRPRATLRFGAFVHSRSGYAARWMMESKTCVHKRVQHDEVGVNGLRVNPLHSLLLAPPFHLQMQSRIALDVDHVQHFHAVLVG